MIRRKHRELVDRLGVIKAQQADLCNEAAAIKAELAGTGEAIIDGQLYRAAISITERKHVNWRAIAERLEPSHQLVTANTVVSDSITVRVSARTQETGRAA